jgi:archaellum component FlaC
MANKKYQVKDLTKGDIFEEYDWEITTHKKTEQELREWAEEIRQNEGLQDVVPNYTEIDNLNGKYFDDLDNCIEFLEEYDWEITEITN